MPYKNPEDKKRQMKKWWAENTTHLKAYRVTTKDRRAKTHAEWRKRNLEKRAADMRQWRSKPINQLASNIRSRTANALSGTHKNAGNLSLLGCSWTELRQYLEAQFLPEWTWKNYGDVWEVDHIKACASFDLTDVEQQKQCFHYSNLRPLGKDDNRAKGAR